MIIERKPVGPLLPFIDSLWYVDKKFQELPSQNDVIIPTGQMHIVFNFADDYYLVEGDQKRLIPNIIIVGHFKEAIQVMYTGDVVQLGVVIHPSSFGMYFKDASSYYEGAVVNGSEMVELVHLYRTIKETPMVMDRLEMVERYFLEQKLVADHTTTLDQMLHYLETSRGRVSIRVMASMFGYSVSGLERFFKKHMGMTPKAYSNIVRFRRSMMAKDPSALFYDQSHFIKMCRKFTKKTPKELDEVEELTLKQMLKRNDADFLQ